jgi:hypothetical protein
MLKQDSETVTLSPAFSDLFVHERAKLVYGADEIWMTEAGACWNVCRPHATADVVA